MNKKTLFFQDSGGDAPCLLFVHGIMMDHSVWHNQVSVFSKSYRIICVDLRGFGQSTTDIKNFSFEDHAEDIADLIRDLNLKDVTLIGWSLGGAISQVFAMRFRELISKLILINTTPQLLSNDDFLCALPENTLKDLCNQLKSNFSETCLSLANLMAGESKEASTLISEIATKTNIKITLSTFNSSGKRSLLKQLNQIHTPTFIITGEYDKMCPTEASFILAEKIPGCNTNVTVILGAGHAPFLSNPELFNQSLQKILQHKTN